MNDTTAEPEPDDAAAEDAMPTTNQAGEIVEDPAEAGYDEEPGYEEVEVDDRAAFLEWFENHFRTVEATGSRETATWCPEWWLHPEVNARLFALFRAHQAAQLGESLAGLSDWWLRHWDAHRAVIFDGQTGPFKDCDMAQGHLYQRVRNKDRTAVPATLPPADWDLPM
jgi:hypothetical protein